MDGASTTLDSADIQQILALLPHRYPFLMVDRIVDINGADSAVGLKNVSFNEPHFAGHFPGKPIMPGVLILEGMAQTAGAISIRAQARAAGSPTPLVYLMTIDEARFRKMVIPGDLLEYHVTRERTRGAVSKYRCVAKVDGAKVAEAIITAMMAAE